MQENYPDNQSHYTDPVNQNEPQSQPHPKKGMTLTTILSLFLILATLIAVLFYRQNAKLRKELTQLPQTAEMESPTQAATPNPTVDWQTYSNNKFAYTVSYPTGFVVNNYDQVEGQEDIVQFINEDDTNTDFMIDVENNAISNELYLTYKQTIEQKLQNNEPLIETIDNISREHRQTEIAGNSAYQLTLVSDAGITSTALFEKDGLIYSFQLVTDETSIIDDFNLFLTTFKFIEQSALTEEEALDLVRNLPEVQDFMQTVASPGFKALDDAANNLWLIQVFETLDTNTATFNWYEVNKSTRSILKTIN